MATGASRHAQHGNVIAVASASECVVPRWATRARPATAKKRKRVKKKFVPGDSAEDIMKTLQNEWAEGVSESERMGYCKRYRKKKVLHELVCTEYVKDKTGGPKRPSTAFFLLQLAVAPRTWLAFRI